MGYTPTHIHRSTILCLSWVDGCHDVSIRALSLKNGWCSVTRHSKEACLFLLYPDDKKSGLMKHRTHAIQTTRVKVIFHSIQFNFSLWDMEAPVLPDKLILKTAQHMQLLLLCKAMRGQLKGCQVHWHTWTDHLRDKSRIQAHPKVSRSETYTSRKQWQSVTITHTFSRS